MFTFGREHEKRCAVDRIQKADQASILCGVVDAVHNFIEGDASLEAVRSTLVNAFSVGGSGVWESTGGWICRLGHEHQDFLAIWNELAKHPKGAIRFRVACFLNQMPTDLAGQIGIMLSIDPHKKTREMALSRLEELSEND